MQTDVLIIGTGAAGLNVACQLAALRSDLDIVLVSKSAVEQSNSSKAQGGIAVSADYGDDLASHVLDTYIAGDRYTDIERIEKILDGAPDVLRHLKLYGLQFDEKSPGEPALALEGGHSRNRIVHIRDYTGKAIITAMVAYARSCENITILEGQVVTELLMEREKGSTDFCSGVFLINPETLEQKYLQCSCVVLATGGVGSLYAKTTNVPESNGEGLLLAKDIGADLCDLEFIQFHPTGLHQEEKASCSLISEAVRGEGGVLVDFKGERFMKKYDSRQELAPRDIVSRSIFLELNTTKQECVYLDCTHFPEDFFPERFPGVYASCMELGIDPVREKIPVTPVQHFLCGGIRTDVFGRTTVDRLYACGECAATGLHGANRLASNSLLECIIISQRIAVDIAGMQISNDHSYCSEKRFRTFRHATSDEKLHLNRMQRELQLLLTNEVGILRTNYGLRVALDSLRNLSSEAKRLERDGVMSWECFEFLGKVRVAELITGAALDRKSNLGGHFNVNYAGLKSLNQILSE